MLVRGEADKASLVRNSGNGCDELLGDPDVIWLNSRMDAATLPLFHRESRDYDMNARTMANKLISTNMQYPRLTR